MAFAATSPAMDMVATLGTAVAEAHFITASAAAIIGAASMDGVAQVGAYQAMAGAAAGRARGLAHPRTTLFVIGTALGAITTE